MSGKEKHLDHKSVVDEQIERGIRTFRKELAALKGKSDADSARKSEELKLQIKRLKAARFLYERQMEKL